MWEYVYGSRIFVYIRTVYNKGEDILIILSWDQSNIVVAMAVLFNLFILSCFTINTTSLATTSPTITKPKRLVTQLIHHNSVYSPYYNPKDTIADRARHYVARVHFGIRMWVRVRDLVIFEKGGCGCDGTRRLKNY